MKNFTLVSVAMVVSSILSNAQTITSSWVPGVGFSQTRNVVNLNGPIGPGSAGQGQTWNFSGATSDSSYIETNYSPANAAGGSNFPLASFGTQVNATSGTSFYVGSSAALQVIGSYAGDVSGAITFTYDNAMDVMQFPASFSSTFNDPYHVNITSPFINFSIDGTNNVLVDGSGSLITPTGTYNNVLRFKSINNYQYIGLPPLPGTVPNGTSTSYLWVSADNPGYQLMNYSINVEGTNSDTTITYSANLLGTITGNGYSSSNNPASLNFSAISSGCPSFSYQWYSKSGVVLAPTGSSTAGWTLIPGATSNTYDPPTLFSSTSYACFVTPLSSCGSAGWASGVASYSIVTSLGTITGNGFSSSNNPASLSFSGISSGCPSFTYQWYSTSGVVSAPTGSSTFGWTLIPGATSNTYDPPTLYNSTSYACFVTPLSSCGSAAWAGGVASFNITTSSGSVNGQQVSQCTYSAVPLTFDSQPVGLGNTTVQWYFVNGSVSCPQGNATLGWTAIAGATSSASSFVPPSSGTFTLACLVTPEGISGLPSQWANGCKTVVVNSFIAQSIIGNPYIIPFNPYTYLVSQEFGHSYSWSAYGGAVSSGQGTNQISVFWAATGPYQVMLIENNGVCSDTSYLDVENSFITQINETEFSLSNVLVFPNPTDVGFTIQSRQVKAGTVVQLYDQMGRMVLSDFISGESTYLNTSALASGIYLLRIPAYPGFTKKISIQ